MSRRDRGNPFEPAAGIPDTTAKATYARLVTSASAAGSIGGPINTPEPPPPAPIPMGDFSAPEFSIEPVTGVRAFSVDRLGRLRGVVHAAVWTPGENTADCYAAIGGQGLAYTMTTSGAWTISYGGSSTDIPKPSNRPPHGLVRCQHGFYGYYDGSNDYYKPGMISGVIEGYGEVVIGTKGFRASKARIIALTIPADVNPAHALRVQRNYPDVAFYDTFAEMVAAHPADVTNLPSPDDENSWTRAS